MKPATLKTTAAQIFIVPSFHYDVMYLRTYGEYLDYSFQILDEALRILEAHSEYHFLVEQVILLEEYWNRKPERREELQRFAREGRLDVAPGMFVMPDMNHPDGESLFMQARIGKDWLREHLGLEPRVCWIADCWGHHAQLPQILRQAGYEQYVFLRCMRRDVMKGDFRWRGLDGTEIQTHWLARGYANINFPSATEAAHALDLHLTGCGPEDVAELARVLRGFSSVESVMLCNGGDFRFPQETAPEVVRRLNESGALPPVRFSSPSEFLDAIDSEALPVFDGEFNSAFQGSFTANIRIKQLNRRMTNRLLALEKLSVVCSSHFSGPREYEDIWRLILKQQFHDGICGTICDSALEEIYREYEQAEAMLEEAFAELESDAAPRDGVVFNPLSFDREEIIEDGQKKFWVRAPALGFADLSNAEEIASETAGGNALTGAASKTALPCVFENKHYRAQINESGYITSLIEAGSGREIVRKDAAAEFGSLAMQMDYGDVWLNFEGPIDGGSDESFLDQNHPDPLDRRRPSDLSNRKTFYPKIERAGIALQSSEELIIEQEGALRFWRLNIPFRMTTRLMRRSPRIEYRVTLHPSGRHYRVRAAFPTVIANGAIRHEIPFGIQARAEAEHVAQSWVDYSDGAAGLALFNRGIPANNVDQGVMLLTLFRSVAMEYKSPSAASFNEGVPHTFEYAIMPHGPAWQPDSGANTEMSIIRNAHAFANPLILLKRNSCAEPDGNEWRIEPSNALISCLRWTGDHVFMRIYEAAGKPAKGTIRAPARFIRYAKADGLQRPTETFQPCAGGIPFALRPFQIQGFLLEIANLNLDARSAS
ncbi:MAG: alpha-mannosidase [Candidatus Sumerlaeota bacterium]|nr:alpha-mannosidase [Candidatus Sumerlaeota bacterium]